MTKGRTHERCIVVAALLVCGGRTQFYETYYFQSPVVDGDAANYCRLTIKRYAAFRSARYLSGYYEEAAAGLLVNELQPKKQLGTSVKNGAAASSDGTTKVQATALSSTNAVRDPACVMQLSRTSVQLTLLDSSEPGSFVMIFSTDTCAIADTTAEARLIAPRHALRGRRRSISSWVERLDPQLRNLDTAPALRRYSHYSGELRS